MRAVWKFVLSPLDGVNKRYHALQLPRNARFLTALANPSDSAVDVYVEVTLRERIVREGDRVVSSEVVDDDREQRTVFLVETGKRVPSGLLDYVGTVRLLGNRYVLHVYFDPRLGGVSSPASEPSHPSAHGAPDHA